MKQFTFVLLAGALLVSPVVLTGTAQADLIGDTVRWDHIFQGGSISNSTAVVDAGVEFNVSQNRIHIDISGSSIRFDVSGGGGLALSRTPTSTRSLTWIGLLRVVRLPVSM